MTKTYHKLLYHTLKGYAFFAVVLLIVSMPVAYFLMQKLHLEDINEALYLRKKEFLTYHRPDLTLSEIPKWNKYNRDIKITDTLKVKKDSLFRYTFYDALDKELEPYQVLYAPVIIEQKSFTLLVRQNLIEEEDLIQHILWLYAGLLTLLLTGLLVLTRYFSKRLWRSFYHTLQCIENFELGKSQMPAFEPTRVQEFERLNTVLQNWIQKSMVVYQNQKEFIENAAHELQTPLAVLQAKLDAFLQLPDLTESQIIQLDMLYTLLARLNRLNKNLLLLAKIDAQSLQNLENTDFQAIIIRHTEFFEEQGLQKNIILHIHTEPVIIQANTALSEILIRNLLHNALQHNISNGTVEVHLTPKKLVVRNTGNPVPLSENKLFERFAKADSSTHGNGLGLAIVKKIADMHQWQVHYSFEKNFHVFEIIF